MAIEDMERVKRDNSVFQIGGIAAKDNAMASVERASTSRGVTDKETKGRSDNTLDESLHLRVCEEYLLIT